MYLVHRILFGLCAIAVVVSAGRPTDAELDDLISSIFTSASPSESSADTAPTPTYPPSTLTTVLPSAPSTASHDSSTGPPEENVSATGIAPLRVNSSPILRRKAVRGGRLRAILSVRQWVDHHRRRRDPRCAIRRGGDRVPSVQGAVQHLLPPQVRDTDRDTDREERGLRPPQLPGRRLPGHRPR